MVIGIIGLGDMGKLYAKAFAEKGFTVCGSDLPQNYEKLCAELNPHQIEVFLDGRETAQKSDLLIFSVETDKIKEVVARYGPYAKSGAIVSGQTSVKHPEIAAFEEFLPADVNIITIHALHGPGFAPKGQKLAVIPHRNSEKTYQEMLNTLRLLETDLVEMEDYHQHDKIVADTQAVTHVGFESMGTACATSGFYPWENAAYIGGIDNVKILIMLRIFSYKAHVYAGMAILNPYAKQQVKQYAISESELFKLMIQEDEKELRRRIYEARDFVFHESRSPILLDDSIMKEYSLSAQSPLRKPNSHLSILSMVDAWNKLQVNPYDNLICQTPPFRLRLGIAEYLFKNEELLEESIITALYDKSIRGDDLEFHSAVRDWSAIINYGDIDGYKLHFNQTQSFFKDRLAHGRQQSAEMIKRLMLV